MSFCHLRLNRLESDPVYALYIVESPDFDTEKRWTEIGKLYLDKSKVIYSFTISDGWKWHKVVPPWVYGLSDNERIKFLEDEYKDHGCGAWTMRIHHYATQFLQKNEYPEKHPRTNFT